MGLAIGTLIACGHTLDEILEMTFRQALLVNEFVWHNRATMLGELVTTVRAGVMGGDYTPPKTKTGRASRADRDAQMAKDLLSSGIPVLDR